MKVCLEVYHETADGLITAQHWLIRRGTFLKGYSVNHNGPQNKYFSATERYYKSNHSQPVICSVFHSKFPFSCGVESAHNVVLI